MKWRATVLVIGIIAAVFFLHLRPLAPDPLWNGRKISAWAHDLVTSDADLAQRAEATLIRIGEPAAVHVARFLRDDKSVIPHPFKSIANRFSFLREDRIGRELARTRAMNILTQLGPAAAPALPHIIPLFNDTFTRDLQEIEYLLRRIGPASAIALQHAVQQNSEVVRIRAAHALRDFPGDQTTSTLIEALRDRSPKLRAVAAESLGSLRATNCAKPLITALSDPFENVRANACEALGAIGDKSSVQKLALCLRDGSPSVRLSSARALWKINHDPKQILPTLIRLLDTEQSWQAAYILGEMRAAAAPAIPDLMLAMRREQVPRPFRSPSSAAFALGQIGVPALPALIEALADKSQIHRANSAIALAFMEKDARPAERALLEMVTDRSETVREAAALTLGRLGSTDPRAIDALSRCLRADDIFLRSQALSLLRELAPNQEWAGNLSD